MKVLIIHQNFPGQFKHLAPALVERGHEVTAFSMNVKKSTKWKGVNVIRYGADRSTSKEIHPWVKDFETKVIRGDACFRAAQKLKASGYYPDKILAHPGWGESLFLKEVWPDAMMGVYCEFYYSPTGLDVGFDPEFSAGSESDPCRIRLKNTNNSVHFDIADSAISPTHWQASTFPESFRTKIEVIHDGIETDKIAPRHIESHKLASGQVVSSNEEIITFVSRTLEPHRGYHVFMRSLPNILSSNPNANVYVVGSEMGGYGAAPDKVKYKNKSWKNIFIDEIRGKLSDRDWQRVHFLGRVQYDDFVSLMQASSVHVYLTYPFVLSWSLLEAMGVGGCIVASKTQPVEEVIQDGETGLFVDFFDHEELAQAVTDLLADRSKREHLSKNARSFCVENYDLYTECLPRQINWLEHF